MDYDYRWFERVVSPKLGSFATKHQHVENGDFGSLDQVEFESETVAGEVEFWDSGWVRLTVVDMVQQEWKQRVLLRPEQMDQ